MISHISIKNFKSLKDISVNTKTLNLLMGLNGMGKTSFIQSLLLVIQSDNLDKNIIDLNGSLVDIGQAKDALYQFSGEDFIELAIRFSKPEDEFRWKLHYKTENDKLTAENIYDAERINEFKQNIAHFQFVGAERVGPQDLYEVSNVIVSNKKHIGLSGEYAAYYLNLFGSEKINTLLKHPKANSDTLLDQVNAWLGEISPGVSVSTKYFPEINKVILDYQFTLDFGKTNSFKPKNVGFGITYVLPVILSLLTAEEGKIIVIENPESHIHPRGQSELGKLITLAASVGAQLFVETHSDHVLNGIRVAVKERLISEEKVNILYFDKITTKDEQYSQLTQIRIDKRGELSEYPKDFLDEWNNQLLKLID